MTANASSLTPFATAVGPPSHAVANAPVMALESAALVHRTEVQSEVSKWKPGVPSVGRRRSSNGKEVGLHVD